MIYIYIYIKNYYLVVANVLIIYIFHFQGLNTRLAFAIAAGAFGSAFQHGYATGVVNAPQSLIMAWIRGCDMSVPDVAANATTITDSAEVAEGSGEPPGGEGTCHMTQAQVTYVWSLVVSIFCVGGMIDGSLVGQISSKVGR